MYELSKPSAVIPSLFVIGAAKCGTTYLHDLLSQHRDIYMSAIKEPRYFTNEDYLNRKNWYNGLFISGRGKEVIGESSPSYSETTYFRDVPKRIFKFNPNAKLVYLVREPFSRLKSVYRQNLSTGHQLELKYYDHVMPLKYQKAIFNYPPFLEGTKYHTHIQNYRRYFNDDAIKAILFEDLISDTSAVLKEIFRFLGVDEDVPIDLEAAEKNTGAIKKIFNPWPSRIRKFIPDRLIKLMPEGAKRFARNSTRMLPLPDIPPPILSQEDEARIREILTPEVEGIYRYLGIEDDPWRFFETKRAD